MQNKRVAILQSNYIPWKGYFDIIHDVDLFIFYDDLQFTKNDWRNRNKIKTAQGVKWLSIPVGTSANRLICEVAMEDSSWQRSHWDSLKQQYGKSPYFKLYRPFLEEVYLGRQWANLSELNQYLIRTISHDILNLHLSLRFSGISTHWAKAGQIARLDPQSEATRYVSGPSAKDYVKPERFVELGIDLVWKDYSGYPEYTQFHPPFEHGVTILDLLFHTGPDAPWFIWGWRDSPSSQQKPA
ncbi:MAG: WbqC family protein [Ahniella sp.]|nr:WbqC family protein [Ahniella sp.]